MSRNRHVRLLPVAVAGLAAALGACSSTDTGAAAALPTTPPSAPATPSTAGPIDLADVPEDTALEAGTYLLPFVTRGDHNALGDAFRAVVDVPAGSIGGGAVIAASDDRGDAAFWDEVTRVAADACLGGSRRIGPSVEDLATALTEVGHMTATRPVPVTVSGYQGLFVKLTAPANLERCHDQDVQVLSNGDFWLTMDGSRVTFRLWILDIDGHRVSGGTRGEGRLTDDDPLNHLIESAEFTSVDEP